MNRKHWTILLVAGLIVVAAVAVAIIFVDDNGGELDAVAATAGDYARLDLRLDYEDAVTRCECELADAPAEDIDECVEHRAFDESVIEEAGDCVEQTLRDELDAPPEGVDTTAECEHQAVVGRQDCIQEVERQFDDICGDQAREQLRECTRQAFAGRRDCEEHVDEQGQQWLQQMRDAIERNHCFDAIGHH